MVDILIIGAGPTGLTLACALKRRGLNIRIIDKLPSPTTQSRALALQARSLEVFEKLGVLDSLLDQGIAADTVHLYENGKQMGMASLNILPIAYPFALLIPQADTEAVLNRRLEELGGHVERNISLLELNDQTAILSLPSGQTETVSARWIVGCDGAHSVVRHALNLPFKGTRFAENFILADVTIPHFPLSHHDIYAFLTSHGILGLIPLPQKDLFRLITVTQEPQEVAKTFLEQLIKKQTKLSLSIEKVVWTSNFSIHRRIVPHMSQQSVFLCGDAAHIHSPAGGQGLNIGIQDSFNLAWKLDLVHRGLAAPALLETYHEERHPVAQRTLWGTTLATFFISMPYPRLRRLLFKLFGLLFHFKPFRKRFAATLAEIKTHYRGSSLSWQSPPSIFWRGPRPGERAPLLEISEESRFVLFIFGAPDFQPQLPQELFAIYHFPLDSVFALRYRAKKPSLYLIRPDGYIASRCRHLDEFSLKKAMAKNLFLLKLSP